MRTVADNCGGSDYPDCRIFIESYAYGAKCAREILGEFGGILRWHLVDYDAELIEVPILTLKRFTTGKGSGQKDGMRMHAYKTWGYESQNNDDCDAFCLYQFGLCVCGIGEPRNAIQREVVAKTVAKIAHDKF